MQRSITKYNDATVLDSREVARMVEKNHKELLRDIRGYIENMESDNERKIAPVDFFIESTYVDSKRETRPCFLVTRKGCEFIANKLTGQKGTIFTAAYINRFHELEYNVNNNTLASSNDKARRLEIQAKNARIRASQTFLRIAENPALPKEYRNVMLVFASNELSGQDLLPLPIAERKTYSATDVGKVVGLSANKVGRLTEEHSLKTAEYGQWYHDKSRSSNKQVNSFRYYDTIIPKLEEIIGRKVGVIA